MALFEIRALSKSYPGFRLAIPAFSLERGGIHAVTGPNGSGKSTLLNLLALLDKPDRGTIALDGRIVDFGDQDRLLAQRRRISFLLQNAYLFDMTLFDNIAYGLRLRKKAPGEIRSRVAEIMEQLGIWQLARRRPWEVSGGEAQRAAIARNLVLEAEAYILDEPTANIDKSNIVRVEELIRELNREKGATVLLTTHNREQAYRLTSSVISLAEGTLQSLPWENVFSGKINQTPEGLCYLEVSPQLRIYTAAENRPGFATVAIDPGSVIVSTEKLSSSARNSLQGKVTKLEIFDGGILLFADAGSEICARITQASLTRLQISIGSEVWLTFKASSVQIVS